MWETKNILVDINRPNFDLLYCWNRLKTSRSLCDNMWPGVSVHYVNELSVIGFCPSTKRKKGRDSKSYTVMQRTFGRIAFAFEPKTQVE